MFKEKGKEKVFRFIEANEFQGISEKTKNPYHIRKVKFADPATFENHQLDYKEGLNLSYLSKGEEVTLEVDLQAGYAGKDSRVVITNIVPVVK